MEVGILTHTFKRSDLASMLDRATRETDFPSLLGRKCLNPAAEGIPPRTVIDALAEYAQNTLLGMNGRERHEACWDESKDQIVKVCDLLAMDKMARFLGAVEEFLLYSILDTSRPDRFRARPNRGNIGLKDE